MDVSKTAPVDFSEDFVGPDSDAETARMYVSDVCDFVGSDSDPEDVFHSAPSTPTASHGAFAWPEATDSAPAVQGTSGHAALLADAVARGNPLCGRETFCSPTTASDVASDHAPRGHEASCRTPTAADGVLQVDPMVVWGTPLASPLTRTPVKTSETKTTRQGLGPGSPYNSPSVTPPGPPASPSGGGQATPVAYPRRVAPSARTPTGPPLTAPRGSAAAGPARGDAVHGSTAVHGGTVQLRGSTEAGPARTDAVHARTAVRGSTAQLLGHALTAVARTLLFVPDPPKPAAPALSAQNPAAQKTLARSGSDSVGVIEPNAVHATASLDSAAAKDGGMVKGTVPGRSGGQQPNGGPAEVLNETELTRKVHRIEKKLREIETLDKRAKVGCSTFKLYVCGRQYSLYIITVMCMLVCIPIVVNIKN